MASTIPLLHCNTEEEDRLAIKLLSESDIPFINLGPDSEMPTPYLRYGYWTFFGIKGIQGFIIKWQKGKLPPLDVFK